MARKTGSYNKLGDLNYFIPYSLPPKDPALELSSEIMSLYGEARASLSKLNEVSNSLPDQERFIQAYLYKEALLSSQIEGIQTTLVEVYTTRLEDGLSNKSTQLVVNYTKALQAALKLLQIDGLPLVNRVILQAHATLMNNDNDGKSDPGNFRKQSVRVGNLVPPPANEVANLMSDLEQYINQKPFSLPTLIASGLAHVQFETIHPFLDGNGRIGRLLIVLMLIDNQLLDRPILYPSYFFKKNHHEYYQRLDQVRTAGDFEGWIIFYLKGIAVSAHDAYLRVKAIMELEKQLTAKLLLSPAFAKLHQTALAALKYLFTQPVTNTTSMSMAIGKSYNTTQKILNLLLEINLITVQPSKVRGKVYHFTTYLELLDKSFD